MGIVGAEEFGLGALGMGGLLGGFGAAGFAPTGGPNGFGLAATGGGGVGDIELEGLEDAGGSPDDEGVFFHGVADPLEDPIPGKTETGFADTSAVNGLVDGLGCAGWAGRFLGGGGGAGTAATFGGASSR